MARLASHNIALSLSRLEYESAIRSHPLFPRLKRLSFDAMECVRDTQLFDSKTLRSEVTQIHGNVGSLIGTLFEFHLGRLLARTKSPRFTPQQKKGDVDILCPAFPILSFEVKTTSSKKNLFGNKVSSMEKKGSFLLGINYDAETLTVTAVRFGWVDAGSWIEQSGNGQRSSICPLALRRMVDCS